MFALDPVLLNSYNRFAPLDSKLEQKKRKPPIPSSSGLPCRVNSKCVAVIKRAHSDPLAGCLRLPNRTFLSASFKSIKIWDYSGKHLQTLEDERSLKSREGHTIVRMLNNDEWISATSFGNLSIWNVDGEKIGSRCLMRKKNPGKEGSFNQQIYTVSKVSSSQEKSLCLAGHVGGFAAYDILQEGDENVALHWRSTTHLKDWVNVIEFFDNRSWLVVTGDKLELMQKKEPHWKWNMVHRLIDGSKVSTTSGRRPFISSLHFFGKRENGWFYKIGVTDFDGTYRIVDLKTTQVVSTYREHQGRVLAAVSMHSRMSVTTGQDRRIKIWDARMVKSVATLVEPNSEGPVSHIEKLLPSYFVTGSSPPYKSKSGSQLTLWDLRKIS